MEKSDGEIQGILIGAVDNMSLVMFNDYLGLMPEEKRLAFAEEAQRNPEHVRPVFQAVRSTIFLSVAAFYIEDDEDWIRMTPELVEQATNERKDAHDCRDFLLSLGVGPMRDYFSMKQTRCTPEQFDGRLAWLRSTIKKARSAMPMARA